MGWIKRDSPVCDARPHWHLLLPTHLALHCQTGLREGLYRDRAEMRGNKKGLEGGRDRQPDRERQEIKISHPSLTSRRATADHSLKHEQSVVVYFLHIFSKQHFYFVQIFYSLRPYVSLFFHCRLSDVSRKSLRQREMDKLLSVPIILHFFHFDLFFSQKQNRYKNNADL